MFFVENLQPSVEKLQLSISFLTHDAVGLRPYYVVIVRLHRAMLWLSCVAINTGNDPPRREDFDALMPSSVVDAPPSDSGTGPNVPAPRAILLTLLLTYLLHRRTLNRTSLQLTIRLTLL